MKIVGNYLEMKIRFSDSAVKSGSRSGSDFSVGYSQKKLICVFFFVGFMWKFEKLFVDAALQLRNGLVCCG